MYRLSLHSSVSSARHRAVSLAVSRVPASLSLASLALLPCQLAGRSLLARFSTAAGTPTPAAAAPGTATTPATNTAAVKQPTQRPSAPRSAQPPPTAAPPAAAAPAAAIPPPHLPPPRHMSRSPPSSMTPSGLPPSSSSIPFLRPAQQQLFDIEAYALTETDPEKKVSLEAYKTQFNYVLQKGLAVTELLRVFRSWVAHMPSPPELPYIHSYIDARVRKGHSIHAVLVDLTPFIGQFTDQTLILVMLLCAKQRDTDETIGALRFIHAHLASRIPLTLPLMNQFINNFSLQNDISGATILYDELSSLGLEPDQETYQSMYLGFARMKEMEAAFSVFGHMQQRGIPLRVDMFEQVIEVCIRYDNAEAGLLALQRVDTFNESQPFNDDGTRHQLVRSTRCFELILRAYLGKQQLDLVMQIYFEMRKADLVLASLSDFNSLIELIAKNLSFQDALQVMADRIQAHEKYVQLVQSGDPAALAAAPIPPPHISSFNILLRIAGLVDRNLTHLQLIVSEIDRIQCRMDTDSFNIAIESYAGLREMKGVRYIYDEFKKSALAQMEERAKQTAESTATSDATLIQPDVRTYNLMLAQINPRTFLVDFNGADADAATPPADAPTASPTDLTPSESSAMEMVSSLLSDMRTFRLLPDESTFKLILSIMSGVGDSGSNAAHGAANNQIAAPSASAAVSPHVVRFFNMLMDLVVAHQTAASGAEAAAGASTPSPLGSVAKPVSTVTFEASWYSFLDFLYRSSNATNQGTNFHYILLCLRRLKRDGCAIPKSVVKSLLLNHLGGAQRKLAQPSARVAPSTVVTPTIVGGGDVSHITEVHWLQATRFLREFSSAEQNIDEDVLGAILKTANAVEIEQRRSAGIDAVAPSQLLPKVLQHMLNVIVWERPTDTSSLRPEEVAMLNEFGEGDQSAAASGTDDDMRHRFASLAVRDRNHFHIFLACVQVRRYDLAMAVITDMTQHQKHVIEDHRAAIAAGQLPSSTPAPVLYVSSHFGLIFKMLLDPMRRYALTAVKPLDWSPLRTLFAKTREWHFSPTHDIYRVLVDEAMRFRSASLARFAYETAVYKASHLTPTQLASGTYWPDARLSTDALMLAVTSPEVQISTIETRASSADLAAAHTSLVEFMRDVLMRMFTSGLAPLPHDSLHKLVLAASQYQSIEMVSVILHYMQAIRKAPDARLYVPLIDVCKLHATSPTAYPLANDLYRAVQLADKLSLETHFTMLHLHAHAQLVTDGRSVKGSMVWTIFDNMVRGGLSRPASHDQTSDAELSARLIRSLLLAVRPHPHAQQVADDLPKIESLVHILSTDADKVASESSRDATKGTDHGMTQRIQPIRSILPTLTAVQTEKFLARIQRARESTITERTRSASESAPKTPTPTAHTPTRLASLLPEMPSERVIPGVTVSLGSAPKLSMQKRPTRVIQMDVSGCARPPTMVDFYHLFESTLATGPIDSVIILPRNAVVRGLQPRTGKVTALVQFRTFEEFSRALASLATMPPHSFLGATRVDGVRSAMRHIDQRWMQSMPARSFIKNPITLEEQIAAIATVAAPNATEAIEASETVDAEISVAEQFEETIPEMTQETIPETIPAADVAVADTLDSTPVRVDAPAAPVEEAAPISESSPPSIRVIGDSFFSWNELATHAESLSPNELDALFAQAETSRLARNMIEHQGFIVSLKLLMKSTSPMPHNRSKMLRLLFQYCLYHRNAALFHQLCTQLHALDMLPRPLAFKYFFDDLIGKWTAANSHAKTRKDEAVDIPSADVQASMIDEGDQRGYTPSGVATDELVTLLRDATYWFCIRSKLPTQVWQSNTDATPHSKEEQTDTEATTPPATVPTHSSRDPLALHPSSVQIDFTASSLSRRLHYLHRAGVPLTIDRVLNVYAFKTVCALAMRGSYYPLATFVRQLQGLNMDLHAHAIFRSSIQWLVQQGHHRQANEVWTVMIMNIIPKLKHHMIRAQREARKDASAPNQNEQDLAAEAATFASVQSLCDYLLTAYVLKHEDDTMFFRVYATMRSLNMPPPADLRFLIPGDIIDQLSPAHQLLYIMMHRVLRMQEHTRIDYIMKLFGEMVKVPTMAPRRFTAAAADATATTKSDAEWPVVKPFLDIVSARIVSEYIRPSWPQKLAKPEFADQIKKLILHLDSDDVMEFSSTTSTPSSPHANRARLWSLFVELQQKGVVFNPPMLHHLSQSLATKDAARLLARLYEENDGVEPLPIPTIVQQIWKLTLHHGEFDQNTLMYLILAQVRHYQSAQQQRGITLRTIRSLEYYRHVLYGTPYEQPALPHASAASSSTTTTSSSSSSTAISPTSTSAVVASSPTAVTSFADVAASGFSTAVALRWLGFKLDSPLPNIVHLFLKQMERDWRRVVKEDQQRAETEASSNEAELHSSVVDADAVDDTELPLNAHSYNSVLQSCLLFTHKSLPVQWAYVDAIRATMADRRYTINSTSELYLLDALIEAGELDKARALLPNANTHTPDATSTDANASVAHDVSQPPESTSLWARIRGWISGPDEQPQPPTESTPVVAPAPPAAAEPAEAVELVHVEPSPATVAPAHVESLPTPAPPAQSASKPAAAPRQQPDATATKDGRVNQDDKRQYYKRHHEKNRANRKKQRAQTKTTPNTPNESTQKP